MVKRTLNWLLPRGHNELKRLEEELIYNVKENTAAIHKLNGTMDKFNRTMDRFADIISKDTN